MTIAATTNRVTYTGNGVSTAFAFAYPFHAQADLVVIETIIATGVQTTKALTTDYTISGTTDAQGHYSSGGTVNAVTAPASTVTWTIYRDPSPVQSTDFVQNDDLPAESLESALDYQTLLNQRTRDMITRSLRQPEGDSATIDVLPAKVTRASKYLAFDADGDPVASSGTTSDLVATPFIETLLDDTTAAAARATLGFPTVSGATTGHALIVDPAASGGMSWSHRVQPNPIINGNMEIWQRGTTFAAAATGTYSSDRWKWLQSGAGVVTLNRSTNVPTVGQAGVLFNYSLEVDVTTADAAIAAGDFYYLATPIEGYNWRHFAQRQLTVSFWVMSPKTGEHNVSLNNGGRDRSATVAYTVNVADTWEFKTTTFTASPSAGTWNYTNSEGVLLSFTLAAGTNFANAIAGGVWDTSAGWEGNYGGSQVNVMDSTANFFRITGVKMELGSVATPIPFVPFEEELARCQRYYEKSFAYGSAPAQAFGSKDMWSFPASKAGAVTNYSPSMRYRVPKRTAVAPVLYNPSAANAQVRNTSTNENMTSTSATETASDSFLISFTGSASTAIGHDMTVHWTADAEL